MAVGASQAGLHSYDREPVFGLAKEEEESPFLCRGSGLLSADKRCGMQGWQRLSLGGPVCLPRTA